MLIVQGPSQKQLSNLLELYQSGQLNDAEKLAVSLTQVFLGILGWKALGAIFKAKGRNSEAVDANRKAVELSPQDAETYNSTWCHTTKLGRLDEVEASSSKR